MRSRVQSAPTAPISKDNAKDKDAKDKEKESDGRDKEKDDAPNGLSFLNMNIRKNKEPASAKISSPALGLGDSDSSMANSPNASKEKRTPLKTLFNKQNSLLLVTTAASSVSTGSSNSSVSPLANSVVRSLLSPSVSLSLSFAEFRLFDVWQQKQRRCLIAMQKLEAKFKADGIPIGVSCLSTNHVKKPFKEPKFKDDKRLAAFGKLGGLLQKKRRKRSRNEIFHLINLAIIDQNTNFACTLLEDISSAALRKKFPLHANKVFYSAMGQAMEVLCLAMMEKGFPLSVNAPITIKGSANLWKYGPQESTTGKVVNKFKRISTTSAKSSGLPPSANSSRNIPAIQLPSYFMAAVGLGLENVVRGMGKRADVNQNWHGLTPLHVAACKNSIGITQFLLDTGADPSIGILVSQYALLRKLKSISSAKFSTSSITSSKSVGSETAKNSCGSSIPSTPILKSKQILDSSHYQQIAVNSQQQQQIPKERSSGSVKNKSSYSEKSADPSRRARASSLTGTTPGIVLASFSSVVDKSASKKQAKSNNISANNSIRNGGFSGTIQRQPQKQTGYTFYGQVGCDGKDQVDISDAKRRSSVFHMWNDEYMKDRMVFPVELAAACGNSDLARILLARYRMDQKQLAKCSFALIVQRDVELSLLFIRAGVPTTQRDTYGSTALHLACRSGNLELVTAFIESKKFDINCKGQNDWTPLHEAISFRRNDVAKYLVRTNANIAAQNNKGETPRDVGIKLAIPKLELDEMLLTISPLTASSFNDSASESSGATSPETVNPSTASPKMRPAFMTGEPSKLGSMGKLNLLDRIKRPKSNIGITNLTPQRTTSTGSTPALNKVENGKVKGENGKSDHNIVKH
ncbi:hypothetical protein HK100_000402 [Physocladia obscura]|uniref:Peptidase A2 domain-containing protein n=1 Tax=Physocladia obscura TaxID=109957 RepID=A0AAD5TAL5_9FUNG|nr:hypothetical protein HK100_000402 [Physocladia obscura]